MKKTFWFKKILFVCVLVLLVYGAGRLYYRLTGGFSLSNISSNFNYDPRWEVHALSLQEEEELEKALNQEYVYLGKGCQSYVFASMDGKYVIKFFKYQRFRIQPWISALSFIPSIECYRQFKISEKKQNLEKLFNSWKIAFDQLKSESGIIYVHLNKSENLGKTLSIQDKLGLRYQIDLDTTEFLIQHRANMLASTMQDCIVSHNEEAAKELIDNLLAMIFSEYLRGFADNDHALLQNTGILNNQPIHIDVGQFIYNPIVSTPQVYKKEFHDKTYHFYHWLLNHSQKLADHLRSRLVAILEEDYYYFPPYVHKANMAKIPNGDVMKR